jgi:hypothetical protein
MGVQYSIAFRHTNARVANQIWVQNNRDDFYRWLYGDEMNYGPIAPSRSKGYDGKFVDRTVTMLRRITGRDRLLDHAPVLQRSIMLRNPYVDSLSEEGMDFNRELRRVGYGYTVDRKKLRLQ